MDFTVVVTTGIICVTVVAVIFLVMWATMGKCLIHGHQYKEINSYTVAFNNKRTQKTVGYNINIISQCEVCRKTRNDEESTYGF